SHALAGNQDARRILYQKGYRGPVTVIPQFGIDPEIYRSRRANRRPGERPVVGFVGRIVPEKGLDTLLSAVAGLPDSVDVKIVGSGTARGELAELAGRLGLGDRVHFPGTVPATDVPALLADLDVLVLPSRSRPNWKEQFGRILIEAMACETPVIGSDSGEIPHVIGDAGLIFPEDNPEALRNRISQVIADPTFAADLGRRGRERALDRFTQQQVARQTYDVYRKVLDRGRKG
ncbi:MAG: glycosyltransferase, partial [Chloroflexota bacterium]